MSGVSLRRYAAMPGGVAALQPSLALLPRGMIAWRRKWSFHFLRQPGHHCWRYALAEMILNRVRGASFRAIASAAMSKSKASDIMTPVMQGGMKFHSAVAAI